jgi:hypothetical protein
VTPSQEILDVGSAISYQRDVADPMWTRKVDEDSARDLAIVALRNHLGASSGALEYLRSVEMAEVGAETVRGIDTKHYRALI